MDTHIHSQHSANTLSMTGPCVSFPPPVMLILDLPTQRISCPFNGCKAGSTQHYSLFGIQPLIDLRRVKTSECSPCLSLPLLLLLSPRHVMSLFPSISLFSLSSFHVSFLSLHCSSLSSPSLFSVSL